MIEIGQKLQLEKIQLFFTIRGLVNFSSEISTKDFQNPGEVSSLRPSKHETFYFLFYSGASSAFLD